MAVGIKRGLISAVGFGMSFVFHLSVYALGFMQEVGMFATGKLHSMTSSEEGHSVVMEGFVKPLTDEIKTSGMNAKSKKITAKARSGTATFLLQRCWLSMTRNTCLRRWQLLLRRTRRSLLRRLRQPQKRRRPPLPEFTMEIQLSHLSNSVLRRLDTPI
ncbi:hypothetical protein RND81_10G010300 [Saponaria officinalis]|uniref:Uncharacterized protein n=1 Tax=Saponaria officinalis TaxID=3572 RepID=A0AAW1HYY0_SAPOF